MCVSWVAMFDMTHKYNMDIYGLGLDFRESGQPKSDTIRNMSEISWLAIDMFDTLIYSCRHETIHLTQPVYPY